MIPARLTHGGRAGPRNCTRKQPAAAHERLHVRTVFPSFVQFCVFPGQVSDFEQNPIFRQPAFSFKQVVPHSLQMDNLLRCLGQPCFSCQLIPLKHLVLYDSRSLSVLGYGFQRKTRAEVCSPHYDNTIHRAVKNS